MTANDPRTFVKSSWSTGSGGDCVEWAFTPTGVAVRDSKDRTGPELLFTFAEWDDLTAKTAAGAAHDSIALGPHGVRLTGPGGTLFFTPAEWTAFAAAARAGECRPALAS